MPLKGHIMNHLELYNEVSFQLCCINMLYFTDYVLNEEA